VQIEEKKGKIPFPNYSGEYLDYFDEDIGKRKASKKKQRIIYNIKHEFNELINKINKNEIKDLKEFNEEKIKICSSKKIALPKNKDILKFVDKNSVLVKSKLKRR